MIQKTPTGTVLYTIEQTIKEYRKICQRNIQKIADDITVDQCLVLIILNDNTTISQIDIAKLIFKDNASVTRIIELMVKKDYLTRETDELDKRKSKLIITEKGKKTIVLLAPVFKLNRKTALNGLSLDEIELLDKILHKIISNCKTS
ncbi:MarR family transcriptional regulator [Flavobacterium sp. AC]|uniref:MarR family transcriptional regulator n=1 Tax=Flavobacterium azizsancarii TaxID=2961580 RepID=A0ABT4WFS0_9FLAO|nr:MarR family transcriptional regulator [Flavobacterium azizsancarii]MDA6071306.1 MarR family transcriptional regulator [Flavobacterium azizsancarii]